MKQAHDYRKYNVRLTSADWQRGSGRVINHAIYMQPSSVIITYMYELRGLSLLVMHAHRSSMWQYVVTIDYIMSVEFHTVHEVNSQYANLKNYILAAKADDVNSSDLRRWPACEIISVTRQ